MRLRQRRHQGGRSDELDAVVVADRLAAEADCQMGLAGSGRTEEQQRVAMRHPTAGREFAELALVERGLGAPVEPLEVAHERELRDLRRSEEHTSELQSLMRISYAVFCLKKKNTKQYSNNITCLTIN